MFIDKVKPFNKKIYLSSPTMHGDEINYVLEAYKTNWMSTVGENINFVEKECANYIGVKQGVGLSSGTSALHLAMKLAGIKKGDHVFCTDMTFSATVNPIVYEGGIPIFIDSERETWNMDPEALKKAFELYPNVKVVVLVHLYGVPGKIDEIISICREHNAILIEDAAESFGALYKGRQTASFGSYNIISFNGNKIITGSCGGLLLTNNEDAANKARKWSTQSREAAPWYQHEEIGYNYRLSNVVAGVIRGQLNHLQEHIEQKKQIYLRYKEGLKGLPLVVNPYIADESEPNYWLSCLLIDKNAMCKQTRSDNECTYIKEHKKSCPSEILEVLSMHNAEGRPIWKPMHMQPIFRMNPFITVHGEGHGRTNAYISGDFEVVCEDIFNRGLCLPSDNKMTIEEQNKIIEIIKGCFE